MIEIIYLILSILLLIAVIWAIVDVLRKRMKGVHKVLWILGLIFFSLIVFIVWLFVRKDYRKKRK